MTAATQQAATAPLGPTGRLATWVAEVSLSDVPPEVVERAKHLLLDGIGCALIGASCRGHARPPRPCWTSMAAATPW